ncbi:uncharacterized protein LOC118208128 isoform X2 [Anguilla anguilla]|uniref:uncharacterized protein LOC118208128 isoform X2 n=1 Tax=Anguilla anguilla TaxID=7936 RepID=UPI0015AA84D2|nr:uncharacterized protein LOC118208128 isoform X2 [Anguilla anguilla]
MGSESPSAVQSPPPTEAVELSDRQHPSIDRFEIYVPKAAEVHIVAAQTLPPGIWKKIGLLSTHGASCVDSVTVTWISPVVVREKGPGPAPPLGSHGAPPPSRCGATAQTFLSVAVDTCSSAPGGRGQCWLPVACSNLTAFKVLRKFMPHGHCPSPDAKWETRQPACRPPLGGNICFSQDAIIIHREHIFLSINKARQGKKRVGHRQSLTPEAPPTLTQQTAPGMPGGPQSAQHSCGRSATPHKKFQAARRAAGPGALRVRFSVERRARVAVARLPDATMKTLSAFGLVDLEKHPAAAQLYREAVEKKLDSSSRSSSAEMSRDRCTEDLAGTRCSGDREKGVVHYRGHIMEEEWSKQPVLKKARRASGGDGSTSRIESVDLSTDEDEGRDLNTGVAMGGDLSTDEGEGGDLSTNEVKGGDLSTGVAMGGDLSTDEGEGGDLSTNEVKGGDLSAGVAMGGDLSTDEVKGGDLSTGVAMGGDLSTDEGEGGDLSTNEVKGGDLSAGVAMGGDLSTDEVKGGDLSTGVAMGGDLCIDEGEGGDLGTDKGEGGGDDLHAGTGKGDDPHAGTGEGDYLHAGTGEGGDPGGFCSSEGMERNGGEGAERAGEGRSGADSQGLDQPYQPAAGPGYTAGFDFDQLARDEKISRIRAQLSEKEAALQQLARLPL